ncbi:MAG: hypothetical protein V2A76_13720 [Planctomycetota bacterium]
MSTRNTKQSVPCLAVFLRLLPLGFSLMATEAFPQEAQPEAGGDEKSALPDAEDVADVPAEECFAGGDEMRRYVLIGHDAQRQAPQEGYGLLLVLPGGSGDIDFHPFVKRIHKNAVPEGFLTVQLVAPVWSESQAKDLVWPTERQQPKEAKFTTEEFVSDVGKEVEEKLKVDRERVFTLTWSSSGPAAYALSLHKKSPVTGSFVAMSVFKPENLPSLSAAKGHAYYILHSPEDFIPISMAEKARDELKKKQAKVEYRTYEGGHGWHGDVFGTIRDGVTWLEQNHAKVRK